MFQPLFWRSCAVLAAVLCVGSFVAAQDMRTWSDASGKFKIKAKFVSEDGGTVTLETEDGKELEIELKKLNSADQKVIAELKKEMSDNPFKSKGDDPFKPKGSGTSKSTPKKTTDEGDEPSGQKRVVTVDWSEADLIALGNASEEWKLDVPAAAEPIFKNRGKTVALPGKTNFFEGLKGLTVSTVAKKAVVGYVLGEPKPQGTTRVTICDLETGKAGTVASAPGQMSPIALHDDGKQIVMRREEWGSGNLDRLEVWTLRGSKVNKLVEWIPYDDLKGGDRDVLWAEFTDENTLATSSRQGRLALWKFPEITPICFFDTVNGAVPGLSPDRKLIAFSNGEKLGVFDVAKREVILQRPTPSKLQWPYLAFSPSGNRIGCIAFDKVICWNTADGELINVIPANGAHFHGGIDFPHDNFILAAGKVLVDVDNQISLWKYNGAEQVRSIGGWTFMAVSDGSKPGVLLSGQLPHPAALAMHKKVQAAPGPSGKDQPEDNSFVFGRGTVVRLDVSGIPDPGEREKVRETLTRKLDLKDCKIDPKGTIDLVATVEGPQQTEVHFIARGDYKMQKYTANLQFVYQGNPVWRMSATNVPSIVQLKRGENMEGHLRSLEKPPYHFFEQTSLPKLIPKPVDQRGALAVHTLGESQVTTTGIR